MLSSARRTSALSQLSPHTAFAVAERVLQPLHFNHTIIHSHSQICHGKEDLLAKQCVVLSCTVHDLDVTEAGGIPHSNEPEPFVKCAAIVLEVEEGEREGVLAVVD